MIFTLAVDKNTRCLGDGTNVLTTFLIYTISSSIGIGRRASGSTAILTAT